MYMAVFYTKIHTNNSSLPFSTVGSGPPWPQEELVQGHPVGKCGKTKAHRMTSTRRMWSSAWKTRSLSLARLLREKPPKRGPYGWRKAQCRGRTTIQMLWSNVSHIDYFECVFCGHGCILTLFLCNFLFAYCLYTSWVWMHSVCIYMGKRTNWFKGIFYSIVILNILEIYSWISYRLLLIMLF